MAHARLDAPKATVITHLGVPAVVAALVPEMEIEGQYVNICSITACSILSSREGGGGNNPGNNLHVSGLSHRVDTRELEQAFAKVGRVCPHAYSTLDNIIN